MQELKRVINYKKLILIAAIALVNIIFFLYANKPVTDEGILSSEKNTHTRYLEEYSDSVNSVILLRQGHSHMPTFCRRQMISGGLLM